MRLWHYKLLPYLPQKWICSQWRECCCIIKNIADNGTPNHILVNKVLDYPSIHFESYTHMVLKEMSIRGYKVSEESYCKFCERLKVSYSYFRDKYDCKTIKNNEVFPYWHTNRYLKQCLFNLEEKADCGGMSPIEWHRIQNKFLERFV